MTEEKIDKIKIQNAINQLSEYIRDPELKDQFKMSIRSILRNDPKLLQAAMSSKQCYLLFIDAIGRASALGLSLDPALGEACITAYYSEYKKSWRIDYQTMKNGYIKLAQNTGQIRLFQTDIIRENDEWEPIRRTPQGVTYSHVHGKGDRGKVVGYYASILLNNGDCIAMEMSVEEVLERAKKIPSFSREEGAWQKSFDGMAIKTLIKAFLRANPITPLFVKAVQFADDYDFKEQDDKNYDENFLIDEPEKMLPAPKTQSEKIINEAKEKITAKQPVKNADKKGDLF